MNQFAEVSKKVRGSVWFKLVQDGSRIGLRRENSQNAFKPSDSPVERLLGFKGTLYRVSP